MYNLRRLAGLNPDQGHFSRIKSEHLQWEYRKHLLLHEITQYDPDIITLQEVDHYYDFFLPELNDRGEVPHYIHTYIPTYIYTCSYSQLLNVK